jgi:hypothetical protein
LPYDQGLLETVFRATDFRSNHPGGEGSFYRAGRVGDWRTSFSRFDGLAFELAAGDMLRATGYEHDRSWWLAPGARKGRSPSGVRA